MINDVLVKPLDGVTPDSDTRATISARPGGAAANQAAWMAHLGADVVFAGRAGARDVAYHRRELARAGVRARLAADREAETGSIVLVENEAAAGIVLEFFRVDDPIGAVPVHMFAGLAGTMSLSGIVEAQEKAGIASLLRRLEAATERIKRLEQHNHELRDALAQALGEQRTSHILGRTSNRDTPGRTPQKLIGQC